MRALLAKQAWLVFTTLVGSVSVAAIMSGRLEMRDTSWLLLVAGVTLIIAGRGWTSFFRTDEGRAAWAAAFGRDFFRAKRAEQYLRSSLALLVASVVAPAAFASAGQERFVAALLCTLCVALVYIATRLPRHAPAEPPSVKLVPTGLVLTYAIGEVRVPWRLVAELRTINVKGDYEPLLGVQIATSDDLVEILQTVAQDENGVGQWTSLTLKNELALGAPFVLRPSSAAELDALNAAFAASKGGRAVS